MEKVRNWITNFSLINGLYILGHLLLFVSMLNVQSLVGSIESRGVVRTPTIGATINTYFTFFYFSFFIALIPDLISEIKYWKENKTIKWKEYWMGWSKLPFYLITAYSRSWAYKLNLAFTAVASLWMSLMILMRASIQEGTGFLPYITFGHPFIEFWVVLLLQPKFTEYCKGLFARELADVINEMNDIDIPNEMTEGFFKWFDFNADSKSYLLMDYYENGVHVPKLHAHGIDSSIIFKPVPLGLFMEKNYHFGTNRDFKELMYNYHKGEVWTREGTYIDSRKY